MRKITLYRLGSYIGLHRQAAADKADNKFGEHIVPLRAKVRNVPDIDREDIPVTNTRPYYTIRGNTPWPWGGVEEIPKDVEMPNKINRLLRRRQARKNSFRYVA
jgi:hypothetical protein